VVTEEAHRPALARKARQREESAMAEIAKKFFGAGRGGMVFKLHTISRSGDEYSM
jgi:hypothetical protein